MTLYFLISKKRRKVLASFFMELSELAGPETEVLMCDVWKTSTMSFSHPFQYPVEMYHAKNVFGLLIWRVPPQHTQTCSLFKIKKLESFNSQAELEFLAANSSFPPGT